MDVAAKDATDSAETVDVVDVTADADAATTDVASAITAACGSSFSYAAVADAATTTDVAVAMTAVSSHLSKQLRRLFYKVKMREIRLNLPRLLTYYFSSVSK